MFRSLSNLIRLIYSTIIGVFEYVRRTMRSLQANWCGGQAHVYRVASWRGPPKIGRPRQWGLCIVEVWDGTGASFCALTLGGYVPDVERLRVYVWDAETRIFDSSLSVETLDGRRYEFDTTQLVYTFPVKFGDVFDTQICPMDIAELMCGTSSRIRSATLIVTTTEFIRIRFNAEDVISRESIFLTRVCNGDEAAARPPCSGGRDTCGAIRGDDAICS